MEGQRRHNYYSFCHSCSRPVTRRMKIKMMPESSRVLMFTMALALYFIELASAETLCGGELVDALQFVCGDNGFYFSRPTSRVNSRRPQKGIVEECCFRSCDLMLLEQYCAKPTKSERDVSVTSLQVIPVLPTLTKDVPRKPLTVKYSKYEAWQRKAAQRLRRGIPAVLRSRKFRRQGDKVRAQEQVESHRHLVTPPTHLPKPQPPREHRLQYLANRK
ncbi:hypothetical protein GJAV_G00247920 [Gymnothorax javanicus]|nr:hypothetical protein GJAV_G00247920 [Gymnothorax javanicus]